MFTQSQAVINALPDAVILFSLETCHITDLNPAAEILLGYDRAQLVGKPLTDLVSPLTHQPDSTEITETAWQHWLNKGYQELNGHHAAGDLISLEIAFTLIEATPTVNGLAICRNIGNRKQLMDDLKTSNRQFRILLNSSPDAIVIYDMKGYTTYLNPAFTKMFGWQQHEVLGKHLDFVPTEKIKELDLMLKQLFATGNVPPFETQRLTRSGRKLDVSVGGALFSDREGNWEGNFVILRNITQRKRTEEATRRQNAYLEALHQTTLGLIARLNLDELLETIVKRAAHLLDTEHSYLYLINHQHNILEGKLGTGIFNDILTQQLEYGKGLAGKVWELNQPMVIENYDDWSNRLSTIKHNLIGQIVGVPLKSAEQVVGVFGLAYNPELMRVIGDDEIELLKRFAQLVSVALDNARLYQDVEAARAAAEAANASKSAFLASVSHELRTPLTAVLGFAKLIQKKLNDSIFPNLLPGNRQTERITKQIRTNINIIIAEGQRLTALINDVLDLAKIESGKVDWHMQPLVLGEVIDRAISATTTLFEDKTLEFVSEISPNLPLLIADHDRIIQVIINLISNAVKFTTTGRITCRARQVGDLIEVSIADTGTGIAPQDIETVFEKFKQAGDMLTDKPQGTGLGLSICKEIIQHHQGEIWAQSTPGQGSTFFFTLPLPPDPLTESVTTSTNITNFNNLIKQLQAQGIKPIDDVPDAPKKILVVDDEATIRELLKQELEANGYQILEAQTGLDALNQAKQLKPDLIILDVMMPTMNGLDATAVLKNDPQTKHIPIIMLSIVSDTQRGYRLGVDRYLTKPIDSDLLLAEAEILLAQEASHKSVLVVDEDASTLKTVAQVLQTQGYNVVEVTNNQDLIEKAMALKPDMIVVNAIFSEEHHNLVKTLRFEKEMENVIIFFASP